MDPLPLAPRSFSWFRKRNGGEVEDELQPFIGKQWILKCETPKNRSRGSIRGTKHPYVVQSHDGYERTTFEEVSP